MVQLDVSGKIFSARVVFDEAVAAGNLYHSLATGGHDLAGTKLGHSASARESAHCSYHKPLGDPRNDTAPLPTPWAISPAEI